MMTGRAGWQPRLRPAVMARQPRRLAYSSGGTVLSAHTATRRSREHELAISVTLQAGLRRLA